ncbi:MAG: two-component regulator propeller domain-containing protein [Prolixibacteraceae bacterium]
MKKLLGLIAFLVILFQLVVAQTVDLRFSEFKFNNNLSSVFLKSIAQDQYGFVWFGTTNGLHRFDGYELKSYLSSGGLSFNIPESHIYELYADKAGWLWISLNSNLCYYDVIQDSIKIIASENSPRGLDSYYITSYAESLDSILYVSTVKTIYSFNSESLVFDKLLSIKSGQISNFIIDDQGVFWVSTLNGTGVIQYNPKTKETIEITLPKVNEYCELLTDLEIYDQKLWIATDGAGVFSYDLDSKVFKNYPTDSEYALNVLELYHDEDGMLWMVDFTGLKLYVKERDFFQGYYPDNKDDYSIQPYVKNIFQDRDHNYWTIHSPGGIGFCPKPKEINRFDSHINSPFHLTSDNVSTICEDQFGNLWMGNPFNGIDVFNWTKGRTVSYTHDNSNVNSLGKGATQCIYRDSKQQMWVGSYWGGLQKYQTETDDFITFVHDPGNPNSLSYNDVRSIVEDRDGQLWIAVHSRGLDRFDPQTNSFTNYSFEKNNLANNFTFQLAIDSSNNLWVATAWGLSVLQQGQQQFKNYVYSEEDEFSISSNLVNTIYIDRQNRLWVGTPQGLSLYQPETDNFMRINGAFANKNIVSISADNADNIWVGTFYGISRYEPESGRVLNLSMEDGLISNNFLPRAVYNNNATTLFFGSVNGLNYFNPLEINYNHQAPSVYITKCKILNQEITNHNSDLLSKNIILNESLLLDYSQKIIEIEFSALNFVASQNNRYAYYLEGFEDNWNDVGSKRNVTYTNLSPGEYIFRVKAANNEGIWNEEGLRLSIVVRPPFWATVWFKALLVFFLLSLLVFIITFRERNLIASNIELEEKVKSRTREINLQKEALEEQKILLEGANDFKSKFFSVLAHDLRGPVSNLIQLNVLLRERLKMNQMGSVYKIIELSGETASNTHALLDDLLIWGKAQTNNIHLDLGKVEIKKLIDVIISNLSNLAVLKRIQILSTVDENAEAYGDANTIKTILRNILSNAIKFSNPESEILISVEKTVDELTVHIKDYGIGMSKELVASLFQSGVKVSSIGTAGEKGTGMGLNLSHELIKLNGGRIWVVSELNIGSIFTFALPLNKISPSQ